MASSFEPSGYLPVDQKMNFTPYCITRGTVPARALLICPKCGLLRFVFGFAKKAKLKTLKNCDLNCRLVPALTHVFLIKEKSTLRYEGPLTSPSVRGTLPKANAAGATKAAVLSDCWIFSPRVRSSRRLTSS